MSAGKGELSVDGLLDKWRSLESELVNSASEFGRGKASAFQACAASLERMLSDHVVFGDVIGWDMVGDLRVYRAKPRSELLGDIRFNLVLHTDYAALESLLLDARAALGQCFAIAGADTDGADPATLWHRAVQAVTDLRRDYDENEDWKTRAEQAEALAGEYERDARRYRWLRENEWDHPIVTLTYGDYDHLTGAELDAAIDAVGGRVEG